jgi:glycosyltransferase involved in cell wall biosynthesis
MAPVVSGWKGAARRAVIDGMDVHRAGGRLTFLLAARRYFRSRLRREAFDVVVEDLNKVPLFTPYWMAAPLVLLVHHLFGRTAFREAGLAMATATWALERPLGRVYRDVPVQAVSESTAADLVRRGFRRERIVVIPNGVDLDFFSPDPSTPPFPEPTLLYLGRLKRYKRIDLVLGAVARLRERGTPARLVLAGQGDAAPGLRRLAARLGIADAVELRGFVDEDEKRRLFRRAWVHVLTSEKEGWGITNMEAAACGTPTVASDSPGLRDSVQDGRTGLLVPHGDVGALADALHRLIADHALRQRLGEQARAFAVEFSWERTADRTEHHLRGVAGAPRDPDRADGAPASRGADRR